MHPTHNPGPRPITGENTRYGKTTVGCVGVHVTKELTSCHRPITFSLARNLSITSVRIFWPTPSSFAPPLASADGNCTLSCSLNLSITRW